MAGIFKITVVCAFFLGLFCQTAAFAYSYDEIVQIVQAEEKAFGKADYSKSLDQRMSALEVQVLGSVQAGSDSLRLRRVCKKLGLQAQEGVGLAAPFSVVVAPNSESTAAAAASQSPKAANSAAGQDKVVSTPIPIKVNANSSDGDNKAGANSALSRVHSAKNHTKIAAASKQPASSAQPSTNLIPTTSSIGTSSKANALPTTTTTTTTEKAARQNASSQVPAEQAPPAGQPASQENRTTLYCVMAAALLGIIGICVGMIAYLRNDKEETFSHRSFRKDASLVQDEVAEFAEVEPEFEPEPPVIHSTQSMGFEEAAFSQAEQPSLIGGKQETIVLEQLASVSLSEEASASQQMHCADAVICAAPISFAVQLEDAALYFVPQNENLIATPFITIASREDKLEGLHETQSSAYSGEPLVSFLCDPFFESTNDSYVPARNEQLVEASDEQLLPAGESYEAPMVPDAICSNASTEAENSGLICEDSSSPVAAESTLVEPVMPPPIKHIAANESLLFTGDSRHVADYAVEWQNALSRNPFIDERVPSGKFLPLPGDPVAAKGTQESFDLLAAEMAQAEFAISKARQISTSSQESGEQQQQAADTVDCHPVQRTGIIDMEFSSLLDAMTAPEIMELIADFSSTSAGDASGVVSYDDASTVVSVDDAFTVVSVDDASTVVNVVDDASTIANDAESAEDTSSSIIESNNNGQLEANLAEQLFALLSFAQDLTDVNDVCSAELETSDSTEEEIRPAAWPSFEPAVSPKISSIVSWNLRNMSKVLSASSQVVTSHALNEPAFFGPSSDEWDGNSYHALAQLLIEAARQTADTGNSARSKRRVPLSVPLYGRKLKSEAASGAHTAQGSEFQIRLRGLFSEAV